MGIKSWIINRLERDVEPDIYYHEEMYPIRKPLAFDLKKRLLSYLRGTKQIAEATTVSPIQRTKENSWEFSDEEKRSIEAQQEFVNKNKNYEKLYKESIILIGPSGAGKSTVAEELKRMTQMSRLCLDGVANRARQNGYMDKFKNADEFNFYMISKVLEQVKSNNSYGIVDFGAGHSVYEDREIFEKVKALLKPFKNIILLLPFEDEDKSLKTMEQRSTGDIKDNKKFMESPCNKELATYTIYGNDRTPTDIAKEILLRIQQRDQEEIIH